MGSTISNVLGAFSLGMLFHSGGSINFDRSAKVYTTFLFFITTTFIGLAYFGKMNQIAGGVLIGLFFVYLISIAYAIYRGVAAPLEASDSNSDNDDSSIGDSEPEEPITSETSPLFNDQQAAVSGEPAKRRHASHSLIYHVCQLFVGFISLSISGYILSHSASTIAESLDLSGTVIGITILSFATTLPEKLVAILSGSRGHSGILVASTAGSNIFLLTLCMGIIGVTGMPKDHADNFVLFELGITWLSSALLLLIVFLGLGHWTGIALLGVYVVFFTLELTVYRR